MEYHDIRKHPWFSPIDWDSLENKEVQPPFVPDVRSIYISFGLLVLVLICALSLDEEGEL